MSNIEIGRYSLDKLEVQGIGVHLDRAHEGALIFDLSAYTLEGEGPPPAWADALRTHCMQRNIPEDKANELCQKVSKALNQATLAVALANALEDPALD